MDTVAYKLKQDGREFVFLVETEDSGNVPRRAGLTDVQKVAKEFREALAPVAAIAGVLRETLKAAAPEKVVLKFGIELGGEAGVPLVTKGSAKANFSVEISW